MAFRNKAENILAYEPDILIIQECEHPTKLNSLVDVTKHTDLLWFGNNDKKGIAIISFNDIKLEVIENYNPNLKMVIPIIVTKNSLTITLFAIWAYNPDDKNFNYIGQVWKGIEFYEDLMKHKNVILIGDFNSNKIWDKLKRKVSHSMVVDKLKSLEITSAYHDFFSLNQGEEVNPTFYMYRHLTRPYHIDYCFVSANMKSKLKLIEIGEYDNWIKLSDHMPLITHFNVE